MWAVEGAGGVGRPLAARLLVDGERVLDVPATLSARVRVFDAGHGRKTDATDAHAVVMAALRDPRGSEGARQQPTRSLGADRRGTGAMVGGVGGGQPGVRKDLPDLTRWMLATGLRIGEALAVSWSDVDLDARTVEVDWKLIRIKGEGLRHVRRVKGGDDRTLSLRQLAVDMLVAGWPSRSAAGRCSRTGWAAGLTRLTHHVT